MSPSLHRKRQPLRVESAAHHITANVATAAPEETVAMALDRVRAVPVPLGADDLYFVDQARLLVGTLPLVELLRHPPHQVLRDLMAPVSLAVAPHTDQEHVANAALRHGLTEVPIVDETGCFLGVMPTRALLQVLRREHTEDLHRMAGIRRESAGARNALEAPPTRRARDRLPWLLVGLAGSMLATMIVGTFERTLEAQLAIAFFMPGLVYLTDAIGTQSEAIMVRGLSTTHDGAGKILWGEVRTGALLGLVLGVLAFVGVLATFRNPRLATAVGLTVMIAGTVACTVGIGLPWLLHRSGRDPAFGSGPLATIIQDVLTLLVYFAAVTVLL